MIIRKTEITDFPLLIQMYKNARIFMANQGNPNQWGNSYPSKQLIAQDIEHGHSYVCEEEGQIIATFYYKLGNDDSYAKIYEGKWINEAPYGVVHRIVSDGTVPGAASFCLDWATRQCANLRIDTHRDNVIMQHMLEKNGFVYCGIIYLEDKSERIAYQKVQ